MGTQFATYTLDEALILYQRGYLTACGLVEIFFRIILKDDPSWSRSYSAKELSGILGISERTIYKAIAKCRLDGYLFFQTEGKIKFARNESALESGHYIIDSTASNYQNAETIDRSKVLHNRSSDGMSVQLDEESLHQDEESLHQDEESLHRDEESLHQDEQLCVTTGSKPSSDGASGIPSDSIQIYFKLFSNLLHARGVDTEKQKKFFEWWIEVGVKNCGFLIKNPVAFLNSVDSLTGEKRLFAQLACFEETQKTPDWLQKLLDNPMTAKFVKLD